MAPSLETSPPQGVDRITGLAEKDSVSIKVSSVSVAEDSPARPKFKLEEHPIDEVPALKVRYVEQVIYRILIDPDRLL